MVTYCLAAISRTTVGDTDICRHARGRLEKPYYAGGPVFACVVEATELPCVRPEVGLRLRCSCLAPGADISGPPRVNRSSGTEQPGITLVVQKFS